MTRTIASQTSSSPKRPRVCLVTEELSRLPGSGGIGAAFDELGLLLARESHLVDILFVPPADSPSAEARAEAEQFYLAHGIDFHVLDSSEYVRGPLVPGKASYAVMRWLEGRAVPYDAVHFHDYKGLGFFPVQAKRCELAFAETSMVIQLHGPTRWTVDANARLFSHPDQLRIDHLERQALAGADYVVSPSQYLLDWLVANSYSLPGKDRCLVLKNVCTELRRSALRRRSGSAECSTHPVREIVLFGRHEDRKGFSVFCDAVNMIRSELSERNTAVTFLGAFGRINGQPSALVLVDSTRDWDFPIRVLPHLDRAGAAEYLATTENVLVVVPSPAENSPYTVLEALSLGLPTLTSSAGGAPELIAPKYRSSHTCEMVADRLAERLLEAVDRGVEVPEIAESLEDIERKWCEFHDQLQHTSDQLQHTSRPSSPSIPQQPLVTVGITHYERPDELEDAVFSVLRQTYPNIELIVVDDHSQSPEARLALERVEALLVRTKNAQLIRRTSNGYLGAARNTVLAAASGEYVVFLDDDDIALPSMVSTLLQCAKTTGASVVPCLNVYLPVDARVLHRFRPEGFALLPEYVPLAGPLSLALAENYFGSSTALFSRQALADVGGYTEISGVGHEDFEIYLRLAQAGEVFQICPRPLFLYEVGKPSMLTQTSMERNYHRSFSAIDFSQNSDAWRDAAAVRVGEYVDVHAHNRAWWLCSQSPTADIRHALMQLSPSSSEYLRKSMELAVVDGSQRLAVALADALSRQVGETGTKVLCERLASPRAISESPARYRDSLVAEVRWMAWLERPEDAVQAVRDYPEDTDATRATRVRAMAALLDAPSVALSSETVELLEHVVLSSLSAPAEDSAGAIAQCLVALFESGYEVCAGRLRRSCARAEAGVYRNRYDDLRVRLPAKGFRAIAEHYTNFGVHEGRHGFAIMRTVFDRIGTDRLSRRTFADFLLDSFELSLGGLVETSVS